MLILSRRQSEKIVFPNLGMTIQVVRVKGGAVRIGIDAPPEIRVMREEVEDKRENCGGRVRWSAEREFRHAIRNRLNTATLGLQLLKCRLERGETAIAEAMISKVAHELREIDGQLEERKLAAEHQPVKVHDRRALIVEDNANECELLAAYLQLSGFAVDTADDGLKAVSYLENHDPPDVVLMDMGLPRLDGPSAVRSIRGNPRFDGVKLFAVSGEDQQELRVETGPRGVDRWFSKPVDPARLVSEIHIALETTVCRP